jgi:hypothetical protein
MPAERIGASRSAIMTVRKKRAFRPVTARELLPTVG